MATMTVGSLKFSVGDNDDTLCRDDDLEMLLAMQQFIEYQMGICSYIEYNECNEKQWIVTNIPVHYTKKIVRNIIFNWIKMKNAKDIVAYDYFQNQLNEIYLKLKRG